MIIDGFLGNRLYSVVLDEDEYALFSELEELREFAAPQEFISKGTTFLKKNLAGIAKTPEATAALNKAKAARANIAGNSRVQANLGELKGLKKILFGH